MLSCSTAELFGAGAYLAGSTRLGHFAISPLLSPLFPCLKLGLTYCIVVFWSINLLLDNYCIKLKNL